MTVELAGRYRIERELGRGGMATVYRLSHLHMPLREAGEARRPLVLCDSPSSSLVHLVEEARPPRGG